MKKLFGFLCSKKPLVIFMLLSFVIISNSSIGFADEKVWKAISYAKASDADVASIIFQRFISRVNEQAKGELKIDYIGANEVIPAGDQMAALGKDLVQVILTPTYHSPVIPETNVFSLSEIGPWGEREVGFYDLMAKLHKEKFGTMPLIRTDYGVPFCLHTNVRVQKLADLQGLKFRSNVNYERLLKKLGIVTVNMSGGEIHTAMERGLVVGFPWPIFIRAMSFQEVTKYTIDHPFWYGGSKCIYVNLKKWDALPGNVKKLLSGMAIEFEKEGAALAEKMVSDEKKQLRAAGMEMLKLSDGENLPKIASEVNWGELMTKSPTLGPKIKEMLTKK